ncbi:hypothetical protein QTP70_003939 [Hemibagrus guttatus]|uniref:Uncharacterized protein n=1 Tax=Hemibagrus guttatus TaxID=175788 RepID=A0AAE0PPH5_9TELE|nr:hypothetical protein QTP70_003939 [Hemibagrus guttatus]
MHGWDSDLSSILLLVHLLPPTYKGHKNSAKISSYQAVNHVVRYLRIGTSVETFLAGVKDITNPNTPSIAVVVEVRIVLDDVDDLPNAFVLLFGIIYALNIEYLKKYTFEYRHGMVVCTQIHRQSTVHLALRVVDEVDMNIGHEVGYDT